MEDAVDAVAHLELILEGLDVNVGGAAFERAHEHLVDKPDNRHLGRHVAQVGDVFLVADPLYRLRRFLIVRCIVAAVQSFDARGDFFLSRQNRFHAQTDGELERMQARQIQGIGRRHQQLTPVDLHRHHASQFEEITDSGRELDRQRRIGDVLKGHHRNIEVIPQYWQQIFFREKPQLDDEPSQGGLLLLFELHHPLEFFAGDEPALDQPFGKTYLRSVHGFFPSSYLAEPEPALP